MVASLAITIVQALAMTWRLSVTSHDGMGGLADLVSPHYLKFPGLYALRMYNETRLFLYYINGVDVITALMNSRRQVCSSQMKTESVIVWAIR